MEGRARTGRLDFRRRVGQSPTARPVRRSRKGFSITALLALFTNAFVSATVVPSPSEPLLVALIALGSHSPAVLIAVASLGNTIGSALNWAMGRYLYHLRDRPWFPATGAQFDAARARFNRYGLWSLLFAWVPFVGEALTVGAGLLRVPVWLFLLVVGIGKTARYVVVAGAALAWFGS